MASYEQIQVLVNSEAAIKALDILIKKQIPFELNQAIHQAEFFLKRDGIESQSTKFWLNDLQTSFRCAQLNTKVLVHYRKLQQSTED